MKTLPLLLASLVTATQASSQTVYVVDATLGPGADFAEIQPALDLATAIDRVEIRPGTYAPANAVRGTTIIGGPDVTLTGPLMVTDLLGPDPMVLVDLGISFSLVDCASPVIIDQEGLPALARYFVDAVRCVDVRLSGRGIDPQVPSTFSNSSGLQALDSTVFIDRAVLNGAPNFGEAGVRAAGNSKVTVANSRVIGGGALGTNCSSPAGAGGVSAGPAIFARDTSEVFVVRTTLFGGPGDFFGFCSLSSGSDIFTSGAGTVTMLDALPDVTLEGSFAAGSLARLTVTPLPGSSTTLLLGRRPVLSQVPGSAIPLTHSAEVAVTLAPGTTTLSRPFVVPALRPGTVMYFQTLNTLPSGEVTASIPSLLVVR